MNDMVENNRLRKGFNILIWLLISFILSNITGWNILFCLLIYPVVRYIVRIVIAVFGAIMGMIIAILIPIAIVMLILIYL